jgi:acyl-CoA thioesterase-1
MSFRLLLVLKTLLLSLFFSHFVAWSMPAFAESPKIMIYGDSLSAAYGIPQQQGWVSLLQKKLASEHYQYEVINASISGETTSSGVSRIHNALKQVKPSIVIIELGANDGLRGLPIQAMTTNLEAIIQQSKESGAKILLVGMRIPPNYGPQYTKLFSQSYVKLSQVHEIPLVPFMLENIAAKANLIQDDGLHPNAVAQPMVLDNIWPHLKKLLKK